MIAFLLVAHRSWAKLYKWAAAKRLRCALSAAALLAYNENYERRRRSMAKRVAPNEPKVRARERPGMGKGRKKGRSTKDEKGTPEGAGRQWFSSDPQGSVGELRIVDFGLRNGERITNHELRTTQKLSGQTKPTHPKLNAAREKGRGNADFGLRIAD